MKQKLSLIDNWNKILADISFYKSKEIFSLTNILFVSIKNQKIKKKIKFNLY
jgi:hypothetical protein